MLDHYRRLSGQLVFYDNQGQRRRTVAFLDACCIHHNTRLDTRGQDTEAALQVEVHLSPAAVHIDGALLEARSILPWDADRATRGRALTKPPDPLPSPTLRAKAGVMIVGGRGPRGFGDTIGQYSGRPYDPETAGGPILSLQWQTARIEPAGIAAIRMHVGRFGRILANEKMLARLDKIAARKLDATDFDKRYYTHELRENKRYQALGVPDGVNPSYEVWNDTHTATLEDYQVNEEAQPLYHPEVAEGDFFIEI